MKKMKRTHMIDDYVYIGGRPIILEDTHSSYEGTSKINSGSKPKTNLREARFTIG